MAREEPRSRMTSALHRWKRRVSEAAHQERTAYEEGAERPLSGYAGIIAAYGGYVTVLAGVGRLAGRELPSRIEPWDLALCAVATFRLSRLVSKDPVVSPVRVPFTAFRGSQGPSELSEEARGEGGRRAVGELIACPFCTGMWVATTLTAGLVLRPKVTRVTTAALTCLAGADALQFGRAALARKAED